MFLKNGSLFSFSPDPSRTKRREVTLVALSCPGVSFPGLSFPGLRSLFSGHPKKKTSVPNTGQVIEIGQSTYHCGV